MQEELTIEDAKFLLECTRDHPGIGSFGSKFGASVTYYEGFYYIQTNKAIQATEEDAVKILLMLGD